MAVPLERLPDDVPLAPGLVLAATTESGETIPVWIVEVAEEHAILTQQHPLAGVTLHFEVEILDIRPATAEELALGHADGAGRALTGQRFHPSPAPAVWPGIISSTRPDSCLYPGGNDGKPRCSARRGGSLSQGRRGPLGR